MVHFTPSYTGFKIPYWINHATGEPARDPTIAQIRAREVDAYYDGEEACSISHERLGNENIPHFYLNTQRSPEELHAYSLDGLNGWLGRGATTDPEAIGAIHMRGSCCLSTMGAPWQAARMRPHMHPLLLL